ncbi:MAG: 50S ribosomal protein L2 [Patescibacteria group bacterium]
MRFYRPTSPAVRQMTGIEYRKFITEKKPVKALTIKLKSRGGRNSKGRITVRHQGGGAKRSYRMIDFKQSSFGEPAKVEAIEYDPYRTAFIARVVYMSGARNYVIAPQGLNVGDTITASNTVIDLKTGNRLPLRDFPLGSFVYNVELKPGQGGKLARSAGTSIKVMAKEGNFISLQMPSGEVRKVLDMCLASLGSVSNPEKKMVVIGKAGRARHMGTRPTVRGSAMNPVDHPYGGGEGRQMRGLKRPKNAWGKGTRGVKTRRRKARSNVFIIQRRK